MSTVQTKKNPGQTQIPFISSSIGKKIFMAFTGLFLLLWVTGHLIGNLQIFIGQDQLNTYAQALKNLGAVLWVVRIIMLIIVAIHIWRGVQLYFENKASRPVGYAKVDTVKASLASRTMIFTGIGLFLYVVYHLLQFTFLSTNPEWANLHDALGRHDVYSMVILGFQNWLVSVVYILAVFFLFSHLSHGIASLFQSLGANKPSVEPKLKFIGYLYSIFLFVGYASIPIAVLMNLVHLPEGVH